MKRLSCFKAAIVAAMAIVVVSCQQEDLMLELSFDKHEFEVPATGGKVEVPYSISNPASGAEWSYFTDCDWVYGCDFSTDGVIVVSVSPNYEEGERSAVVSFLYSALDKEFTVTLVQKAGSPLMPTVVFDPAVAEVASEGGSVTVSYTVENPVAGGTLSGAVEAGWITDLDTSVEGKVSFNVCLNYIEEERTADIIFNYADMEFALPVVQSVGNPDDAFKVSIVDVGYKSSVARIVPADSLLTYLVLNEQAWYFDQYENDIDALVERTLGDYRTIASIAGTSFEDFMNEQVLSQGAYYFFFTDMMYPDTDYTVWVMGMTPEGETITKAFFTDYRTLAPDIKDITFDIDVNVYSYKNATVEYTPSDDSQLYFCNIRSASDFSDPNNITRNTIQDIMNTLIWRGSVSGKSPEEVVAENCVTGNHVETYSTTSGTDYIAYACAVDNEGVILSEPSVTRFRSSDIKPSENTFDIKMTPGVTSVTLEIVPSVNEDEYTAIIADEALIGDMTTEEFAARRAQDILAYSTATSGPSTIELTNITFIQSLTSDTQYSVFVFGFAEGNVTTDVTRLEVKTLPCEDPATLEFGFDIVEIMTNEVNADVTVNQETSLYACGYMLEEETADDVIRRLDQYADRLMVDLFDTKAQVFQYLGVRGSFSTMSRSVYYLMEGGYGNTELESGTSYKFYAVGVDDKTGEYKTDVFFSDPFITLPSGSKSYSPKIIDDYIMLDMHRSETRSTVVPKQEESELSYRLGKMLPTRKK